MYGNLQLHQFLTNFVNFNTILDMKNWVYKINRPIIM